jgi:hypothetical protein
MMSPLLSGVHYQNMMSPLLSGVHYQNMMSPLLSGVQGKRDSEDKWKEGRKSKVLENGQKLCQSQQ